MLDQCIRHYGLSSEMSSALRRLALLCFLHHPCGYRAERGQRFSLSLSEVASILEVRSQYVCDVLRYGALFGFTRDIVLFPSHFEFSLNSFHRRDLFFACLQIELREKTFSL